MKYILALYMPFLLLILAVLYGFWISSTAYLAVPIAIFDIIARTREFIALGRVRASTKLFALYRASYCQRAVVCAHFPEAWKYYKEKGYKFYHLMPDNYGLFKLSWWRKFLCLNTTKLNK